MAGRGAGGTGAGAGGAGTGGTGAAIGGGTGGTAGGGVISKVGITQCNDGIDNDGDGKIDLADPECTGPYDNDEGSFATGIPGDNMDACKQDCFFDGNSGMGDDGCLWQLQCDPLSNEPKCAYDPSFVSHHSAECSISDSQSQHCIDKCRPVTPNGCDCFGCCQVPGAAHPIRLDSTCKTTADFGDPEQVPGLHAGHAMHEHLRALPALPGQDDAAPRLRDGRRRRRHGEGRRCRHRRRPAGSAVRSRHPAVRPGSARLPRERRLHHGLLHPAA